MKYLLDTDHLSILQRQSGQEFTMKTAPVANPETAILSRLINPDRAGFTREAAQAFLQLDFDKRDREQMHKLSLKAQEGNLDPTEQTELESYRRIGYFLDLIRSKARASLKKYKN